MDLGGTDRMYEADGMWLLCHATAGRDFDI